MLKHNGTLIIAVPCFGDAKTLSGLFVKLLRAFRIMPITYFFGADRIESEISEAGLTVIESTDLTGLPEKLIVAIKL